MKIDWRQKLSSRTFWAMIVGFVTSICIAFGMSDNSVAQVASIITAGGSIIAYIIGEKIVDAKRSNTNGSKDT